MTSERKIDANRTNASKSTGPKTEVGKRRSRRNAWRHGLTAETVVEVSENSRAYKIFESKVVADMQPQTTVEHELIVRLASLMWRLRRATAIEGGLLQIHGEMLRSRCDQIGSDADLKRRLQVFYNLIPTLNPPRPPAEISDIKRAEMAQSFLRFCRVDGGTFDRLGRYETRLWRQLTQTVLLLGQIEKSRREPVFLPNGDIMGFVRGGQR